MSDMKHCPFCGYNDTIIEIVDTGGLGKFATVSCQICGAEASGIGVIVPEDAPEEGLKASAIQAWNSREEPRE